MMNTGSGISRTFMITQLEIFAMGLYILTKARDFSQREVVLCWNFGQGGWFWTCETCTTWGHLLPCWDHLTLETPTTNSFSGPHPVLFALFHNPSQIVGEHMG